MDFVEYEGSASICPSEESAGLLHQALPPFVDSLHEGGAPSSHE